MLTEYACAGRDLGSGTPDGVQMHSLVEVVALVMSADASSPIHLLTHVVHPQHTANPNIPFYPSAHIFSQTHPPPSHTSSASIATSFPSAWCSGKFSVSAAPPEPTRPPTQTRSCSSRSSTSRGTDCPCQRTPGLNSLSRHVGQHCNHLPHMHAHARKKWKIVFPL